MDKKSLKVVIVNYVKVGIMLNFPMKTHLSITALVAILGFALIGAPVSAQAQTTTTAPAPAAKPAAAKKTEYTGTLTAVSAASITVQGTKDALTLAISPKTKIEVNKKKAALTDFAVGDKVTGSYTKDATGAMTAASLRKKTATPAKTTTTTPATPATTAPAAQ
jgi:hypothetical protein